MVVALAENCIVIRVRGAGEGWAVVIAVGGRTGGDGFDVSWHEVLQPARIAAPVVGGVHLAGGAEGSQIALALVVLRGSVTAKHLSSH